MAISVSNSPTVSTSINGMEMPPPNSDLSTMWNFIEEGIRAILQNPGTMSPAQWSNIYTVHFDYCTSSASFGLAELGDESKDRIAKLLGGNYDLAPKYFCADLYLKLSDLFSEFTNEMDATLGSVESDQFLQSFVEMSDRFNRGAKEISRIFHYIHRSFIQPMMDEGRKLVSPLITIATMHSRRLFFNHIQVLADGVLKVVELQRMGSDINIGIVKKVVESFISAHGPDSEAWILPEHAESDPLFIYREYLHIPIITAAQEYYEATSKQFLRENCDSDYITWAEKMQKHAESYKLESFLHTITHDKLISTCKRILSAEGTEGNIPDDAEYILRRIAQSAEGTGNDPDPSVTTCKLYLAMHESQKSLKIYKGPAKLLLSVCRSYTVWSVDFGDMLLSEIGHNTPHQWYRDVLRAFDESAACDLVQTLVQRGKVLEAFKSLFQSVPKRVLDQACENDDSEEGKITEAAWLKFSEMDEDISEVLECLQLVFSAPDEVQNILRLRDGAALSFLDLLDKVAASTEPDDRIHIQCEQTLQRLCRRAGLLPSSFTLNDELSKDGEHAITAGGFADVFIGTYMGKKVALKALRVHGNENLKKVRKSFCREAVFWRQFSHPNIVPFLGISDPKLFPLCMVSQWMENGSLLVYLRRYPRANRLNLLVGVAEGLLYLHQMGAVHGDVKSANILIDDAHRACLADFGLARITHDARTASAITTSTAQHGSIRWMAPELFNPEQAGCEDSRASAESDIYAVGMVTLEAFTGKIPFHHYMRDATVVLDVTKGMRPDRPGSDATALGLTDLVWNLMELCWQAAWSARPRIDFVLQRLKDAQSNFVPPEEDETQFGENEHSDSEYSTEDENDARRLFRRDFTKATPDS